MVGAFFVIHVAAVNAGCLVGLVRIGEVVSQPIGLVSESAYCGATVTDVLPCP